MATTGGLRTVGPRETPAVEVARLLLEYLLSGAIEPGQRLPSERELARAMGVGRSAIRDALKPLTLLGLLDVRQGDGTYLQTTSSEFLPNVLEWGLLLGARHVNDLVEARIHLEGVVARLAAERRTPVDLDELRRCVDGMRDAQGDVDVFVDADMGFHLRVAEASGNEILAGLLRSIQALSRVWIRRVAESSSLELSYGEHLPVLSAIVARDPEAAASAMGRHMLSASSRLRASIAAAAEPADFAP